MSAGSSWHLRGPAVEILIFSGCSDPVSVVSRQRGSGGADLCAYAAAIVSSRWLLRRAQWSWLAAARMCGDRRPLESVCSSGKYSVVCAVESNSNEIQWSSRQSDLFSFAYFDRQARLAKGTSRLDVRTHEQLLMAARTFYQNLIIAQRLGPEKTHRRDNDIGRDLLSTAASFLTHFGTHVAKRLFWPRCVQHEARRIFVNRCEVPVMLQCS